MVRPRAARAHSPLHAEQAAGGNRAGQPRGLHAVPLHVAARRRAEQADGTRRAPRGHRAPRWIRVVGGRVGARRAAVASRSIRPVDARHAVSRGRGRLGATLDAEDSQARVRHADSTLPPRAWRCLARAPSQGRQRRACHHGRRACGVGEVAQPRRVVLQRHRGRRGIRSGAPAAGDGHSGRCGTCGLRRILRPAAPRRHGAGKAVQTGSTSQLRRTLGRGAAG